MGEKSEDLRQAADALRNVREERFYPEHWDDTLIEAEIAIRGVAAMLEARRP